MSRYLRIRPSLPPAPSHGLIVPRSIRRIPVYETNLQTTRSLSTTCQKSKGVTGTGPTRKQITIASDDGRVKWGELSRGEKASRATQQSLNFMVVLVGVVMTGGVFTFLYKDVFAPDSKTRHFNRAVDRIKDDSRCLDLLGDSKKIRAYGEPSWNKWTRNRPIATTIEKDRLGQEHMKMNFNVSGPKNNGVVSVHLIKGQEHNDFEYQLLALDVKGYSRIYLERAEVAKGAKKTPLKFLGIQWR